MKKKCSEFLGCLSFGLKHLAAKEKVITTPHTFIIMRNNEKLLTKKLGFKTLTYAVKIRFRNF